MALPPAAAEAHALLRSYDLPVPLGLFMGGAAAAVALSFVVAALFLKEGTLRVFPQLALPPAPRLMGAVLGVGSVAGLLLLIAAGVLGVQHPVRNITPVAVWVVWWVGFAFFAALVADPWPMLNPWSALARWSARVWPFPARRLAYPERLEGWPAFASLAVFAWMELIWPLRERPAALSGAIVLYSCLTLAGMALFGREVWLSRGEVFAKIFAIFGRFAPVGLSSGGLVLRAPAAALAAARPADASTTAFILLLLATVTFDGLLETPLWRGFAEAALADASYLAVAGRLGVHPYVLLATLALPAFAAAFAACFLAACGAASALVGRESGRFGISAGEMARILIWSLVPIAIAYHLAHYLSYLLVAGQLIFPLASDPFGWGWDLFGTRNWRIRIDVVGPRFLWWTSVIAIVTGHAIGVWIAHVQALRRLGAPTAALRSQLPMLVLMVGYTVVSLWILAQPITEPPAG